MPGDKFRFRFRKTGPLRLLSHHDLMRCAERMLRRADLPFKSTAGFHPTPRLVFALSLPLGVAGLDEVVELEVTRPLDGNDVLARLIRHAPEGLTFTGVREVEMKATAVPRRVVYRLPLPPGRAAALAPLVAELLTADKVWVNKTHPKPRRVNVRPYIRNITLYSGATACASPPCDAPPDWWDDRAADAIELDLWVTVQGTARAEDLFRRLGLRDVLDAGFVLERTRLEIHDEVPAGVADAPPTGPPETAPLDHAAADAAGDEDASPTADATWGLSPNGPVVE
jgi:radical SAM-linked protein